MKGNRQLDLHARDDTVLAAALANDARKRQGAPAPLLGASIPTSTHSHNRTSAARRRLLHVGHFAFMRSVVQGLDLRASWERYFRVEGEASDQRVVRATIAWIRDEFAAAAKREDRYSMARLVRIDATRIADPSLDLPSLEVFAEARGQEDARPMLGFKTFRRARILITGIEVMHMIRKGQLRA